MRRPWTRIVRSALTAIFGALIGFGVFVAVDVVIAGHQMGLTPGQEGVAQAHKHLLPQTLLPLVMLVGAVIGGWVAGRTGRR
jgi:cell division protein FtsX